ncbi:hypothetical protein A2W24_06525 [Microgenomates group bacterium RBG_16_45_19]|nr:MAG: hypothetical protein A2W24_06525 [Microgenomates group bacterium RBG_16_45_19]
MLTKRTNIIFDEADWRMLAALAQQQGTSVGHLVRQAVSQTYRDLPIKDEIKLAHQKIRSIRHVHSPIDYKELINYGRKH